MTREQGADMAVWAEAQQEEVKHGEAIAVARQHRRWKAPGRKAQGTVRRISS